MCKKTLKDYRFWVFLICAVFYTVIFAFDFAKFRIPLPDDYGAGSCAFIYLATALPFIAVFSAALSFKVRGKSLILVGAMLAVSYIVRILFANHLSPDYLCFLSHWMESYRNLELKECFIQQVGNYPPLYNYFLILFSRLPIKDVYLMKVLSLYFEIPLYLFAVKIVAHLRGSKFSFEQFAALTLLPTFLLNSSQWAQCDAMYTSCAVAGVYFALRRKSIPCYIAIGLGLAFKLQIFLILPAGLVFLLVKDGEGRRYIRWRWIWIVLLTFIIFSSLPVCFGGSFFKVFKVYIDQIFVGNKSGFNTHCANIMLPFSHVPDGSVAYYILLVFFIVVAVSLDILIIVYILKRSKGVLDSEQLVFICLTLSLTSVYFMPKMLDRFYHIAEIFAFIYFLIKRDKNSLLIAVLIETAQITLYMRALAKLEGPYVVSPLFTGFALFLVIMRLLKYFPYEKAAKLVHIFDGDETPTNEIPTDETTTNLN